MNNYPHQIIPPSLETGTSRNCLRMESIEPAARCNLKPRTVQAQWLVENRPNHIEGSWQLFGKCMPAGADNCDSCLVYTEVVKQAT